MFELALSDSFVYLCYGSTMIINICTLTVWGFDVYRREILTTKVDPRAVRVNDDTNYCLVM